MSFEPSFFAKIAAMKGVLAEGPALATVVELRDLLDDSAVCREFFKAIDRPDWIVPLREAGYFARPPTPIAAPGEDVQHPPWSASKYLVRMAQKAPAEVAKTLLDIETENVSIIGDLIDAASKMPVDVAVKLVPPICRAATAGYLGEIYFSDAAAFCVNLVKGDQIDEALILTDALFTPLSPGRPSEWSNGRVLV